MVARTRGGDDEGPRRLQRLAEINTGDLLTAFGLARVRRGRALLAWACRQPARRFARQVLAYDTLVGQGGLASGGAWVLQQFVGEVTIVGQERLPRSGPLLIVANHPGLCDTTALFAAIPRVDLQIIAADRPFLRALPHTLPYLYLADETAATRQAVARSAIRHLRSGAALLTFPAGQIEPDPAVLPGAMESLERWKGRFELFLRLVPGLVIVPAIVSGVLAAPALRHPLTRIRRRQKDREWLGATLQLLFKRYQDVHVRVVFGSPVRVADGEGDWNAAAGAVLAEARSLVDQSSC